jgi:outer membrane protein assembly factor BamB
MPYLPSRRVLGLSTMILAAAVAAAPAADWARFRGPNGTGISDDTTIPVRFKEGDGVLWKVAVPGIGNSSPVISKGKVFLQSASKDGSQRMLLCLDAVTGKTEWSRSMPGAKAKINKLNSLASATPAADGDRVYDLVWDGARTLLTAYDYEGSLQWKQEVGPYQSQHGAGTSPVEFAGRVYVNDDQDGSAVLRAFDGRTGKPLWHAERKAHRACYSPPIVRDIPNGGKELVVVSTTALTGYDPTSGAVNWNWDWVWPAGTEALRTVGSPVVWKDIVYAYAGNGGGNSRIVAVRAGGNGVDPKLIWEKNRGTFAYVPCLLVAGDHLFTVQDKTGVAGCFDAATGKEVWTQRLGGEFYSSPVLIDGKVYLAKNSGDVFVFPSDTRYKLLARNSLGESILASPAVADGRLYIRGEEHLFCIGQPK